MTKTQPLHREETRKDGPKNDRRQRNVRVYFLPSEFQPEDVASSSSSSASPITNETTSSTTTSTSTAVVIDILRATTTMIHALKNGVHRLVPCATIEDAYAVRRQVSSATATARSPAVNIDDSTAITNDSSVLLGGERDGIKIDGFDLSNSPKDYDSRNVRGKTIGFTTTNGTKALVKCRLADHIYIGAFCNLTALAKQICDDDNANSGPIYIVCAGSNGQIAGEDVLFAGALCDRLMQLQSDSSQSASFFFEDSSQIAMCQWRYEMDQERSNSTTLTAMNDTSTTNSGDQMYERLRCVLRTCKGGRGLVALGPTYEDDIDVAAQVDSHDIVGVYVQERTSTGEREEGYIKIL